MTQARKRARFDWEATRIHPLPPHTRLLWRRDNSSEYIPLYSSYRADQSSRMKQKAERARVEREKREERQERERELARIKNITTGTQTKREMEEQKAKNEAALLKRKAQQEKEDRNNIRAKIEAAKQERQSRAAAPLQSSSTAAIVASPSQLQSSAPKEYTTCSLSIRLPSGSSVKHDFLPSDTLRTVHNFLLGSDVGLSNTFSFATTFPPRKVYRGEVLDTVTLTAAGS
jgi:hypothetical protein